MNRRADATLVEQHGDRNVDLAANASRQECKIDRATELIRDEIANDLHSIAGPRGGPDGGPGGFPPLDANSSTRLPIRHLAPQDGNPAIIGRERSMLGGVGRQLMQHHRHRLSRLRTERQLWTVELGVAPRHVGRKLAPHELTNRDAFPLPAAQELVRRRH